LTVKPGKFNITNKSSATKKVAMNSSDGEWIFDGEITTKDGTVSINELIVSNAKFVKKTIQNPTQADTADANARALNANGLL
jgi:hypothetical protein